MEVELAATHEAGHAVIQWLVGWEVIALLMTVEGANASNVSARCPHPPLDNLSAFRKRLLVLFAGTEATQDRWPGSMNDWGDWHQARSAAQAFFQRPNGITWYPADGRSLRDTEVNTAIQDGLAKCGEVVGHPSIREAIVRIARLFAATPPAAGGKVTLPGSEAIAVCQEHIGEAFRTENPWAGWIAGGS